MRLAESLILIVTCDDIKADRKSPVLGQINVASFISLSVLISTCEQQAILHILIKAFACCIHKSMNVDQKIRKLTTLDKRCL